MLWPVSCNKKYKCVTHTNTKLQQMQIYISCRNRNTCSEATGTVGRVADKGRESEAGSAER